MSDDQPRRRRRSSISEHIHRERHSYSFTGDGQLEPSDSNSVWHKEALSNGPKLDNIKHAKPSLHEETGPSSFTHSTPHSRMPSTSTPGSSPSVMPVVSKDDDVASQKIALRPVSGTGGISDVEGARDKICSSPTWHKDTTRKEKRVTKRLEAERKELEKRLQKLEEAQTRLDNGIFERNSRRLTKKQPLGSSSRSSSANADRPQSAGAFTAFFSGSRRSSRSRANSVDGDDHAHQSADTNLNKEETPASSGPPFLPLTLPERFGTAISRELASKHGTSLILSGQLQRPLHTTTKSDDLRESWKTAEAWQRKNGGYDADEKVFRLRSSNARSLFPTEKAFQKSESLLKPKSMDASTDLDRELFTAALKHENRDPAPTGNSVDTPGLQNNPSVWATLPSSRDTTQSDTHSPEPADQLPARATARKLHGTVFLEGAPKASQVPTAIPIQGNSTGNLPKKAQADPSPHYHQKTYKSSPLAANPTTTDEFDQKETTIPKVSSTQNSVPAKVLHPSRFLNQYRFEEPRGRSRLPVVSTDAFETAQNQPREINHHDHQQSSSGPPQLPVKSGRRSQENWPQPKLQQKPTETKIPASLMPFSPKPFVGYTSLPENTTRELRYMRPRSTAPSYPQEPSSHLHQFANELPGNKPFPRGMNGPRHSRSSSRNSSPDEFSNYDTADEETPSSSEAHSGNPPPQPSGIPSSTPIFEAPAAAELAISQVKPRGNMPTRPGPMNTLKRKPLERVKVHQKDQMVAKVFVICCRCRYWHDMPSEVYAKLACPERLPTEPRLGRPTPKQNPLISPEADPRIMPASQRRRALGNVPATRSAATADTRSAPLYHPSYVQCCWCGHRMSRLCCQGWTTVVQMRERHH
ncbi:hypothetical protein NUU61_005634 [Penicillium alfredii]|uniref:Uncharacterized protein n=1 Tax=Penicillium alfredii TaxID=1506179 RepID=A0A9W9F9V7_9EURO|nr:uncharacterized protein NUU61_005634 [Penicillium alfredii]KAJ5096278.1 hypothetical protein NUU61_005634 [Penicillium alfredii]